MNEISIEGMKRLGDAEGSIRVLSERTHNTQEDIRDIKTDLKNIFDRIRIIEIRVGIIVGVITIAINLAFKFWD